MFGYLSRFKRAGHTSINKVLPEGIFSCRCSVQSFKLTLPYQLSRVFIYSTISSKRKK